MTLYGMKGGQDVNGITNMPSIKNIMKAKNQSFVGQVAVAQVVMNRVER